MGGWQILSGILAILCLGQLWYVRRLHRAMEELGEEFAGRIKEPSNALLGVSCRDKSLRRLAVSLNGQLEQLSGLRHRYEQGDRRLRIVVTNLSHDIRTPLTAICGYLELLKRQRWINGEEGVQISAEEARQTARYIARIEERAEAMKRLTEELFSYFAFADRAEAAGQTAKETEELSLNAVLEESLAGFYGAFTGKGLTPEVWLPETPVRRRLNRAALSRIFDNILANALKYSDRQLRVWLTPEGEIYFSNPAQELDSVLAGRLFDRFFTVEAGREATGLGLSIARLLAEQMGGSMDAKYREGWLTIVVRFS